MVNWYGGIKQKKRPPLYFKAKQTTETSVPRNYIQCGNYLWNKFSNFITNDICRKR
jgi:hypothetical protein